jgi:hypothetical protein
MMKRAIILTLLLQLSTLTFAKDKPVLTVEVL